MCCLWWSVWQRDAVRKSNPQKMTLARQRVLSSSEVRASDLEHGGSWVRIPSGAQIFSVSSYGWFFTSPFISFIKKTIALMHVYVTQANFTTKPRFEIKNKRSFTEMNSQGSRVEKNTHAQKVQMQKILFTNEACWWNLLVWRNHA